MHDSEDIKKHCIKIMSNMPYVMIPAPFQGLEPAGNNSRKNRRFIRQQDLTTVCVQVREQRYGR